MVIVPLKEFAAGALIGAPVAALTRTIFGPRPVKNKEKNIILTCGTNKFI